MPGSGTDPILRIMKPIGKTVIHSAGEPEARSCAVESCGRTPDYPAPRSREALSDLIWLCLEHVRAYNTSWDFYAGMSESEIEAHRRADAAWRRPTWPLGVRRTNGRRRIRDPFGMVDGDGECEIGGRGRPSTATPAERQALATLGLKPPVGAASVKARYKELVKALHPDANGGDARAEERLKVVNQAYNTLRVSRTP